MKKYNLLSILFIGLFALLVASCKNDDKNFPDFDYSTVYFAYQYPVRTIVLGEDTYDTSLDNEHKCKIYATMGGVYSNSNKIDIDFVVDNSLCDDLYFEDNTPVKAMPSTYYKLADNKISLNRELNGGVIVELADAFFDDEDALKNTYVIPLRMTDVVNADSILSGSPIVDNPIRTNEAHWNVVAKDYVLYCLKYINTWDANYLRRGVDLITENGTTTTNVRHKQYVEYDEECSLTTNTINSAIFPVKTAIRGADAELTTLTCNLILTFNDKDECTITSGTEEFKASGTGKFVKRGDKKSWGNKDRDVIYLDYNIDFNVKQYATQDTLVVRDRGIKMEEFLPTYKVAQ